jgi:hypothetical protein
MNAQALAQEIVSNARRWTVGSVALVIQQYGSEWLHEQRSAPEQVAARDAELAQARIALDLAGDLLADAEAALAEKHREVEQLRAELATFRAAADTQPSLPVIDVEEIGGEV